MLKKKILLFFTISLLFSFTEHKYYLSLTDITYNKKSKSLQIITDVFMDDIEFVLNNKHKIDLQLTSKYELKNNDKYFEDYLKKNMIIKVNNLDKPLVFIGKKYDGDLVSIYYEIEDILNISSIEVKSTILTKTYPEQQNIIKVTVNNERKSVVLDAKKEKGLLAF